LTSPYFGYAAIDSHTPASSSSDRVVLFVCGIGWVAMSFGFWKYTFGHVMMGVFQLVYSLEQAKSRKWTDRLNLLSKVGGCGQGGGFLILFMGCHFAHNQQGTEMQLRLLVLDC
jgi:hypothetical protein